MADIVVKDLGSLVSALDELIDQFQGALDFQNDEKGNWGQLNANLSMGDFADNWTISRDKMVDAMNELRKSVQSAEDNWASAEQQMSDSLEEKK